jgi:hypothetical protein
MTGCEQPAGSPGENQSPPPALAGIALSQWPDIIVYAKGQLFDPSGLVVVGTFTDETERELGPGEYSLDPPDTGIPGAKQVWVRAGAFSAWFPIMVNNSTAVLQSITLTQPPDKTVYALGEPFDKTGMVVTGRYYDSVLAAYTDRTETVYAVSYYDRARRGKQELSVTINRKTLVLPPVETRIPADAVITINVDNGGTTEKRMDCQQIWLKGAPFDVPKNLKIRVEANGVTVGVTNEGVSLDDFSPVVDTNVPGGRTITLTLDDATAEMFILVPDIEPEVFFDYGYWRHQGNPKGTGPGGAEQYTVPLGRSLALAPILNLVKDASFSWEVSGGDYTDSGQNSAIFTLTPAAAGNYTVTVKVSGASIATGAALQKTVSTTVVCLPALPGTPPAEVENPLFTPPLKHFSPNQFLLGGTGYGWSLGTVLGYEVWRWRCTRATNEFHIYGNAFAGWEEPGIVWVMCDENANGLPDDTWYELKGSDDESDLYRQYITRQYAINWFDYGKSPIPNQYGQLISSQCWVDSKGRSGFMGGGWLPSVWGEGKVTFIGTMIRDDGEPIYGSASYLPGSLGRDVDWGYVDSGDTQYGPYEGQNGKFFVSNAIQRDGTPANLPWIDFIKVQTAIFQYGTGVGDISTEIHSADGLGSQTDFPLP